MNNLSIIAGAATFIVSMLGFFLAVRTELQRSTRHLLAAKLDDEKRHSLHERRLAVVEQNARTSDCNLVRRLDDINNRISQLYELYLEHLKEQHY